MKHKNKQLVYISYPNMGEEKNKTKVKKIINSLNKKFQDCIFVNPAFILDATGYSSKDYIEILCDNFTLLDKCDEMWVISDNYKNYKTCIAEIAYCRGQRKNYLLPDDTFSYGEGTYTTTSLREIIKEACDIFE